MAPLTRVLAEDYPALKRAAADALGALGDPKAIPALQKAALEGGQGSAQESVAALRRLGRGAPAKAGAALCTVASQAVVVPVAGAAAQAAVALGTSCDLGPVVARALARGGAEALPALELIRVVGTSALTAPAARSSRSSSPIPTPRSPPPPGAPPPPPTSRASPRPPAPHWPGSRPSTPQGRQEWVSGPLPTEPGWGTAAARADGGDAGSEARRRWPALRQAVQRPDAQGRGLPGEAGGQAPAADGPPGRGRRGPAEAGPRGPHRRLAPGAGGAGPGPRAPPRRPPRRRSPRRRAPPGGRRPPGAPGAPRRTRRWRSGWRR